MLPPTPTTVAAVAATAMDNLPPRLCEMCHILEDRVVVMVQRHHRHRPERREVAQTVAAAAEAKTRPSRSVAMGSPISPCLQRRRHDDATSTVNHSSSAKSSARKGTIDYSRSPKNPALQQLQKSSRSASTAVKNRDLIWVVFRTPLVAPPRFIGGVAPFCRVVHRQVCIIAWAPMNF